jgi:hypothetical protein
MGVALALDAVALSVFTAHGHHQRCITINERISRNSKKDAPIPPMEVVGAMIEISRQVVSAVKDFRVRHVCIKGYAHDAKWQIHQVGEVAGVVKVFLWQVHRIVPEMVNPSIAVRHVMQARGRFTKEEIRDRVENGLGIRVKSNLEVDATVVARYGFDRVAAREKELSA